MPKVSVIIPTYQHAHFVGQTIESVLGQTYGDYEVIVVDDGSTDNTSEVLAEFGPRITVIRHRRNRGLSAARNSGISTARGDYVAFLDADDVWMPDKLEKQVPLFDRNQAVGLVYSDALHFDESGVRPEREFDYAPGQSGMIHTAVFVALPIPMPTVVVRRSCFDMVGLFDEALCGCADLDMWLRISNKWAVDFVDEPLAKYRLSESQMHKDTEHMLVDRLRAQEKAFANSPELRELDASTLERCFYDYYLRLARWYISHHQGAKARQVLNRYIRMRGLTRACLKPWCKTWMPRKLLDVLTGICARIRALR